MININVKTNFINDKMKLPEYAREGDACVDIQANTLEDVILAHGEQVLIPTGLFVELPKTTGYQGFNWVLDIVPRSGLANKFGITITNSPGKIDSQYRGEIGVIIRSTRKSKIIIRPGDRIAQMQLSKSYIMRFTDVSEINATNRGTGGFGSSGS